MVRVAGSTLWMHVFILLLVCGLTQPTRSAPHHTRHGRTLRLLSVTSFSLCKQYSHTVKNCHPRNLKGISSNISESVCAFSKYLSTVEMHAPASDETKDIKHFTAQFKDLYRTFACNYTIELDARVNLGKDYDMKCLRLNVLENLNSWLNYIINITSTLCSTHPTQCCRDPRAPSSKGCHSGTVLKDNATDI